MLKLFFGFRNYLRFLIRAQRFTKVVLRGNLNLNSKNQLFTSWMKFTVNKNSQIAKHSNAVYNAYRQRNLMKVYNGRDTEGFPDTFLLVQKLLTWPIRFAAGRPLLKKCNFLYWVVLTHLTVNKNKFEKERWKLIDFVLKIVSKNLFLF